MKAHLITTLAMVTLLSVAAEARRDQKREVKQETRIHQGVESGELTKEEAHRLRKGQRKVDHMQRQAMKDGVVSPEEKAKIEAMQDVQSKKIYNQKHDEQKRETTNP